MVGRVKPRKAISLFSGDITIHLHPNQEWSSVRATGDYLVRHKIVSLRMDDMEINEYFEERGKCDW